MDNDLDAPTVAEALDATEVQPEAAALRELTYGLLGLDAERVRVADVGAGAGRAVAELHGRGLDCFGIEPDPEMLRLARTRWPECDFRPGHAEELPLPDHSITGYRADKVLHELRDPAAALAEAHRVLEPGGRVVLLGQDWTSIRFVSDDQDLADAIVRAMAASIPSPSAPLCSRELLLDAGFADVEVQVLTGLLTTPPYLSLTDRFADAALGRGAITADQHAAWRDDQHTRAARDRMQIALPLYLASGRR